MTRGPTRRRHDWMAQATSYSQDPEDIALICKSERYGFCIESSDRIPNGYDASFRYDAILFLSLSLSLWLARFRARWNLEWRHATFNP